MRIHRLLGWSEAREALHVAVAWKAIADAKEAEKKNIALEGAKALRDLTEAWRISLETPEIDIRAEIDALLMDLEDKIALMQEHF
jgi:hypothetical protein